MDVKGVEALLFSTHQILATVAGVQELRLDNTEAKELAEAISNVSRHYDVAYTEKAVGWSRLFMALGMVYGTRLYAIRERRRADRATPVNQPAAPQPAPQPKPPTKPGDINIPGVAVMPSNSMGDFFGGN